MELHGRIALFNCQPIGDTVFTTPLPRLLKAAYPAAALDMVIDARTADIFRHNPFVDRVISVDTRSRDKVRQWLRGLRAVRAARYDLAINLSTNEGYSGLAALCGARRTCGFSTPALSWRFRPLARAFDPAGHLVDANVALLRAVGVPADAPYTTEMWVDGASHERAAALWHGAGLPESAPVAGINVGAGKAAKRWPAARLAELADALWHGGVTPLLLGGPGDVCLAEETLTRMGQPATSLAGKTSLLTLAAVLTRCNIFITADTGPMHVASAVKTPTVALFGPTDARRCGPFGVPHRVVRAPAGNGSAPAGMAGITAASVLAAVSDVLAELSPAARR